VTATWMVAENKKPGSPAWRISDTPKTGTSRVSPTRSTRARASP
jgi:hypothetical protein